MDEQATYHPLLVLHDIVIVLDYSILGYGQHVSPFNSLSSSPSNLWHEGRCQYQHQREFLVPSQTDEEHSSMYVSLLARNIQAATLPSTSPFLQNKTQTGGLIQLHTVATPPEIAKQKGNILCNVPLFSTMRYFIVITIYTIHKHYKKHNLGTWSGCIESRS